MSALRKRLGSLMVIPLILGFTSAAGQDATAASPKFVVTSPTTAPFVLGKIAVSATLGAKKGARIRLARFYVNDALVTTDRHYPFKIKRGVTFDTRELATAQPYLELAVRYEQRKRNGKVLKKTIKKSIRVSFIEAANPSVKAQCASSAPAASTEFGYPLAFSDDFDCGGLDTTKWNTQRYDRIGGWDTDPLSAPYNGLEGAAYATSNVAVSEGALNLKLTDSKAPGATDLPARSTGMVNSKNKFSFKYGYAETRALVPDCIGCWPTFWMMPQDDSWPPEIDIFEYINFTGYQTKYPHSVFHWALDGPETDSQSFGGEQYEHRVSTPVGHPELWEERFVTRPAGSSANYTAQWHTYGLLWKPDYAEIYLDGRLSARVVGASKLPQKAMYLIYQMAIGTPENGVPPAGQTMKIDYLHVYSSNN